ncbi:hypothetical protein [Salidesulfovibrio onnuriiensis]|uniref:hypothetical protein n=1 Tax=Salidesulfovibrio onnuriiensis TaxID=2583823 RepID=UPI0011C91C0A|nr:hypothetical protein [Salidesulfovibrio onnuriiensis]
MPQVAARITDDHEKWLKEYFKTKSAGAEFILPWAVDVFFKSIRSVSSDFSVAELKTLLESHKEVKLLPNQSKQAYLLLRVEEACEEKSVHIKHGASKSNLEVKLRRLTDLQATALMIWATAYWTSKSWSGVSIDDYVKLSCS